MVVRSARWVALIVTIAMSSTAAAQRGQDFPSLPGGDDTQGLMEEVVLEDAPSSEAVDVDDLAIRLEVLEEEMRALRQAREPTFPRVTLSGYVDAGAFFPFGDGAGIIQDLGNQRLPRYRGQYGWVFLGDILATAVNARGEAADLGPSPGVDRFDSVDSGGAPGFILNEASLSLRADLAPTLIVRLDTNFVPRSAQHFSIGDFVEVRLAELEWVVSESVPTSVFVGKIEPVFGIEYRARPASNRLGVTPSLVGRYNMGSPLGLKVRSRLLDDWLILAGSVTNGGAVQEQFHFNREIDSNFSKTFTGRASLQVPLDQWLPKVFSAPLALGFSGQYGVQDFTRREEGAFTLWGPDLEYSGVNLQVRAQLMFGEAPGDPSAGAFSLDLRVGGYAEVAYLIQRYGLYARFGIRDADVALGDERLYVTRSWRLTFGARVELHKNVILKVEFLKNFEFSPVPQIDNDILTSSLLLTF